MTTPKVATQTKGGSRFYMDEATGERQPGVTSILNMLAKPGLRYWFAKTVAEEAVENFSTVLDLVGKQRHDAAIDFLKRAPGRQSGKAAETGTVVHGLVEQLNRGEDLGPIHPDYEPFITRYRKFLDDFQPEFLEVEATLWNSTVGYAGTADAIARISNEVVVLDLKTGKSGIYPETGLQLCAYANAEFVMEPNGDRRPLPKIEAAAAVHLRPEKCQVIPIRLGPDVFETFVALRSVFHWETDIKHSVVGRPVNPHKES